MLIRRLSSSVQVARSCTRTLYSTPYREELRAQMDKMRADGTYKSERVLTSPQSAHVTVQAGSGRTGPGVLNFCANNYLGLANDPALIRAAKQALDERGFGLSSVRFICGTQDLHKDLEDKITEFHGTDATILYPSCFDANAGLFEAVLGPDDAIFSDALNHASIIDGIRLCRAKRHRYGHMDMEDLDRQLQSSRGSSRFAMIATDGSFSMDGDISPLAEIVTLARRYDSLVFVDDCHGTGLLGDTGRGSLQAQGVQPTDIDILNSTLGKALGGATGGYTTGRKEIIDLLRQKSRPYLFSNALAPAVVGAGLAVFDMLLKSTHLVQKLADNTHLFRSRMKSAGFHVLGDDRHPIAPILLGDARIATRMADELLNRGIYVIGFSYPVVPQQQARIRVQLSAAHSADDVNAAVDAFIAVGKQFQVIP